VNHDDFLILLENNKKAVCLITDNHKKHIIGHLPHIWKLRILEHVFDHVVLWARAKRMGIPSISLEDVLENQRKRNEKRDN